MHHGRLFLTHIGRERQVLKLGLDLARVLEPDAELEAKVEEFKDRLSRIDEVQLHLDVLLPYLSDEPTEPIRFLAQLARDLWAESNQRQMPLWKKPDDPLCKLLSEALAGIGRPLAQATISEILRGRRRNR